MRQVDALHNEEAVPAIEKIESNVAPDFSEIINDRKANSSHPEETLHRMLLMEESFQIFRSRSSKDER